MRTLLLLSFIVIGLQSTSVLADADGEREALTRILHELELLGPLLVEAEAAADPDGRIRFQYHWLKKDLEEVRSGIREHVDAPRNPPRVLPPLRGDYRR